MKKTIILLLIAMCVVSVAVAQIPQNLNVERIQEEGKTDESIPYLMTIEFLPATGEAFFTFSVNMDLFEQSDAMIAIRDRAEKFMEERQGANGQRAYYAYSYRGADSTQYDAVNNTVHYTSRIRFDEVRDSVYSAQ